MEKVLREEPLMDGEGPRPQPRGGSHAGVQGVAAARPRRACHARTLTASLRRPELRLVNVAAGQAPVCGVATATELAGHG